MDVGAGRGAWLSIWKKHGVSVLGIDGSYVNTEALLVHDDEFEARDLATGFSLARRFDLATSFEVAEHLPPSASERFVRNLLDSSDLVAFSAAVVGQGGEHHVNERPLQFWRELFQAHGYVCYDCIRPPVSGNQTVVPWYRNNVLLYANKDGAARLSPQAKEGRVSSSTIHDGGDIGWRLRKAIVRLLPRSRGNFHCPSQQFQTPLNLNWSSALGSSVWMRSPAIHGDGGRTPSVRADEPIP